ncbi:glutamine amidotransferase class-I [Candidatus Omnitrophus magneticus]|uniref:Glutamine amidotransferase class-I n=1 Tax=Candidatus Omnitrophus magneticus TaxID=1609969 RepID=A0A0F0CS98_9BACT|nr:glutamine amidotransferase class-I [Candidatus Omnitrophus magneticus]
MSFEGLGFIETWAQTQNHTLTGTHFYKQYQLPAIESFDFLVIMGGPMGVYDEKEYPWLKEEKQFIKRAVNAGKKILGVCLGAQLIADALGARVYKNQYKELGWLTVSLAKKGVETGFFKDFPEKFMPFHWHNDTFDLPKGASRLAETKACKNQAFSYKEKILALQFHFEAGEKEINNWIKNLAVDTTAEQYVQPPKEIIKGYSNISENTRLLARILKHFEAL